jgi:hypothetical protein
LNFMSQIRKESQVFPGVFYTLHKMSEARRSQLRLKIAESTSRIRYLLREMGKVEEKYPDADNRPDEATDQLIKLSDQMEEISQGSINPAWLMWGCKSIEGLEIDGVAADPKMLHEFGPPALYSEIVEDIKKTAQLNGEEEKNSESPTISGEATDGAKSDSSAVTASSTDSSEVPTETAKSTLVN